MTIQNQFIYIYNRNRALKAIADEFLFLKLQVAKFFNNDVGKTYDDLAKYVENKELLKDITEHIKAYISISDENYKSPYVWFKRGDIDVDIMNYWREYEAGNRLNVYDDILHVKECREDDLFNDVLENIRVFAKGRSGLFKRALSLNEGFTLRTLGDSYLHIGDELLKVIIANHVQQILTVQINFEQESRWFIEFLATKLIKP